MKAYKREIDRACRELDRERRKLESQQVTIQNDIKKAAKANQLVRCLFLLSRGARVCNTCPMQSAVKIMAKDYVRCKKHVQKFYQMRTHLQGVGLKLQVV